MPSLSEFYRRLEQSEADRRANERFIAQGVAELVNPDISRPYHSFPETGRYSFRIGDIVRNRKGETFEVLRKERNRLFLADRDGDTGWAIKRHWSGERAFQVVGQAWPGVKSPHKCHQLFTNVKTMRQETKEQFYNLFQIGVEIEGEFILDADDIKERSGGYFDSEDGSIKTDGSLSDNGDGHCLELVTPVIEKPEDEDNFLKALSSIQESRVDYKAFSHPNDSAGTHIHLDFSPTSDKELKKIGWDGELKKQFFLYIFDSVEFERYFFEEYFKAFKLKKFWRRLQNRYCQTYIGQQSDTILNEYESIANIELVKSRRDRYRWLNYECLSSGKGIEFRIFPYIQTTDGIREVVDFTQATVLRYWKKKANEKHLKWIADYFKGAYEFQPKDLHKYDRIIFDNLRIEGRYKTKASFDLIEFLAYLHKKGVKSIGEPSISNTPF